MIPLQFGISPGYAIISGIVLLAVLIYTILEVRKQAAAAEAKKTSDPAMKQLQERYERGEISKEDYKKKKKRLKELK